MQPISYQTALHNAQELLSTPADNILTELAVLKQLEVSVQARMKGLMENAKTEAQLKLTAMGKESGSFVFNGHTFSLSKELDYQITAKPQKYTFEDGVNYRNYARSKAECDAQSAAYTKLMAAIESSMPTLHPTIQPDKIILKLSVLA